MDDMQNNMFSGQQWENPVKVGSKVAISGTPTVIPPPVWMGRVPIPMNTNQQQAMAFANQPTLAYMVNLQDNAGYPTMQDVNHFGQQNQQNHHFNQQYSQQNQHFNQQASQQDAYFRQNPKPQQQKFQNQGNDGQYGQEPVETVSAAWRRRQRRRAQRNARAQKEGGTAGPVSPNRRFQNNLSSQGEEVEELEIPDGELLEGDPHILVLNADLANEAVEVLENGNRDERHELLQWMMPVTLELALSVSGCRVVQAAVEVAGGEHRSQMTQRMHGHVAELLDSPHGNHVLQKCIEVLPPDTVQFVLNELCAFPDHGVAIAKHRFGCRILERLLEHCPAEQTRALVENVIENAYVLCRHPFGNYVVQHVLEYGTLSQRNAVVEALLEGGVMQLAMHRVASNVIERALVQCTPEGRRALVGQLVVDPSATLTMASSRYGSFIAQRLLELPASPQRDEVWQQLYDGLETLKASKHGKQLVASIAPEEAETESGPEHENAEETDDS
jgi:hypothetical protein